MIQRVLLSSWLLLSWVLLSWVLIMPVALADSAGHYVGERLTPVDKADAQAKLVSHSETDDGYEVVFHYLDDEGEVTDQVRFRGYWTSANIDDGHLVGPYTFYTASGEVEERGEFDQQGRFHGTITTYQKDGQPFWVIPYRHGEMHGAYLTYQDGYLLRKEEVRHHQRHGTSQGFYEDGSLRYRAEYVDGQRHGKHKQWDTDGRLTAEMTYEDDNMVETIRYFEDGSVRERGEYVNRYPAGEHVSYHSPDVMGRYRIYGDEGRVLEERVYGQSGDLERHSRSIDTPHGQGREVIRFHANGEVSHRQQSSDDRQWNLSLQYDEDGEIRERRETVGGRPYGDFIHRDYSGGYSAGTYQEGQMHGQFYRVNQNGKVVEEGSFHQGKRIGSWLEQGYMGLIEVEYNEQGQMHGRREERADDGSERLVQYYADGVRHGEYKRWVEGELVESGQYEQGDRDGEWFMIDSWNSYQHIRGHYRRGTQVGEWERRDHDGFLLRRNVYDENGEHHGVQLNFTVAGALESAFTYRHGKLHGTETRYYQGMPYYQARYKDGKLVEVDEIE